MKRVTHLISAIVLTSSLAFPPAGVAFATSGRTAAASPVFDQAKALAHITSIAGFGARREGSAAEGKAVTYCVNALKGFGYSVGTMPFKLPNGTTSRNVIAVKAGRSAKQVIFGAHLDSKSGSPGANDNGSGVGTVLEMARVLKDADVEPTVVFVLFGAEEMFDANADHHHYGSRTYVAKLTAAQRRNIVAMVSADMIGYGSYFYARTMGTGPQTLQSRLRTFASARRIYLRYLKDTSRYGWSDHEPFERAGVPVSWIEWRADPTYHTAADRVAHLQPQRLGVTGQLLLDWTASLTSAGLVALRP